MSIIIIKLPNTQETFDWLEENCGSEWNIDYEDMEYVFIKFDNATLAQLTKDGCPR